MGQEVFGETEDLADVNVVYDVDVGIVHVHVVHRVLSTHTAESIKGTSETDKQEWTMSLSELSKKYLTTKTLMAAIGR